MRNIVDSIRNLVIANRILAHEGVVDALGHVSVCHPAQPDRFLPSRSHRPGGPETKILQLDATNGPDAGLSTAYRNYG